MPEALREELQKKAEATFQVMPSEPLLNILVDCDKLMY
jgi:hypothetical protein